jgi:hypothetical protein
MYFNKIFFTVCQATDKVKESVNIEKFEVGDDLMITDTETEVISVDHPE